MEGEVVQLEDHGGCSGWRGSGTSSPTRSARHVAHVAFSCDITQCYFASCSSHLLHLIQTHFSFRLCSQICGGFSVHVLIQRTCTWRIIGLIDRQPKSTAKVGTIPTIVCGYSTREWGKVICLFLNSARFFLWSGKYEGSENNCQH
jgi:hypothetical protein